MRTTRLMTSHLTSAFASAWLLHPNKNISPYPSSSKIHITNAQYKGTAFVFLVGGYFLLTQKMVIAPTTITAIPPNTAHTSCCSVNAIKPLYENICPSNNLQKQTPYSLKPKAMLHL